MVQQILISLLLLLSSTINAVSPDTKPAPHTIAILGLGGRCQMLLLEFLQQKGNIRVVAVCDDHASASFNWFANVLQRSGGVRSYVKIFEGANVYADTEEGIKKMCQNHPNVDSFFITSSNDKHFGHLNAVLAHSTCKNIYMEKPLFHTLQEYQDFKTSRDDAMIAVGLTLRYSNMAKIVAETLQEVKGQLGTVHKVKSWERLALGHGMTIIMMNWRRSIKQSGGLLLEKSIHDLDLSLFFMHALGIDPQEITINTQAEHRLYKASEKKKLIKAVAGDTALQDSIARWVGVPFQRVINFVPDKNGYLDISGTIEKVFADFPDNDNFKKSDIIPDHQVLSATCKMASGASVAYELEVDMSGLRTSSERGVYFECEHGTVLVDIMNSVMDIKFYDGTSRSIDLQTNNSMHAGGDAYIAQLMLGTLPADRYKATLKDEVVQLATFMGLLSEEQAVGKRKQTTRIKKSGDQWMIQ
jgi:predicted dehydrogenase